MNAEERIQMLVGQLHFRIAVLEAELEEARKKLAESEPKEPEK
jgi:hypothetical protein